MIRLTALRLWRLLAIITAGWLLMLAGRQTVADPHIPLEAVRFFFPDVVRLVPNHDKLRSFTVVSRNGNNLGTVLTTSPEMDDLIGYAGPSNLLLALDLLGTLLGVHLLSSADTISHVDAVRASAAFWKSFSGWRPNSEPLPKVEAVGASTLTSLAMTEAVERRLTEKTVSRRFPMPLSLSEVQSFFPLAKQFRRDDPRQGWQRAVDDAGTTLGFVLRTSPQSDNTRGYRGPTESLVSISADGQKVLGVKIRNSYDTPEYVDRVREDGEYLALLANRTLEEWRKLDFAKTGIEGVSGATQTSFAVAEGIRKRLIADEIIAKAASGSPRHLMRNLGLGMVVGGALLMAFSRLRSNRRVRLVWQMVLILGFGLCLGDLLSLSLFAGWARYGIPWQTAPALILLAALALLIPWLSRRNVYCQQLCPHGAAQELLGKWHKIHLPMVPKVQRSLSVIPIVILLVALLLGITYVGFDLARLEPFDAWSLRGAAVVSTILAGIGLVASLFVPMAYCRFGCPTGLVLNFMRTGGPHDRFGQKDWVACGFLAIAMILTWLNANSVSGVGTMPKTAITAGPVLLQGKAFGSTWSVKIRSVSIDAVPLQSKLQTELDRLESTLSHWKPLSATAQFNASKTTQATEQPKELIMLVARAMELSRATDGAYDITVGPLVQAWGYGPAGEPKRPPSEEEIARVLKLIGWQMVVVDAEASTLRKLHPEVQLDLGSLLQGYAADRLSLILKGECQEYLIEMGGELLASGEWTVAIENPLDQAQPLRTLNLKDEALATSGVHRSAKKIGDRQVHHFISPKTGRPVQNEIQLCSVQTTNCLNADGWATALFVSGLPGALQLADTQGLRVWILDEKGGVQTNQQ